MYATRSTLDFFHKVIVIFQKEDVVFKGKIRFSSFWITQWLTKFIFDKEIVPYKSCHFTIVLIYSIVNFDKNT